VRGENSLTPSNLNRRKWLLPGHLQEGEGGEGDFSNYHDPRRERRSKGERASEDTDMDKGYTILLYKS